MFRLFLPYSRSAAHRAEGEDQRRVIPDACRGFQPEVPIRRAFILTGPFLTYGQLHPSGLPPLFPGGKTHALRLAETRGICSPARQRKPGNPGKACLCIPPPSRSPSTSIFVHGQRLAPGSGGSAPLMTDAASDPTEHNSPGNTGNILACSRNWA